MNEIRIKLEIVLKTELNVSEVRKNINDLGTINPVIDALANLVSGHDAKITSNSASYATRFGRKPKWTDGLE